MAFLWDLKKNYAIFFVSYNDLLFSINLAVIQK